MDSSDLVSFKTLVMVLIDFESLANFKIRNNLKRRKIRRILKSKGKSNGR